MSPTFPQYLKAGYPILMVQTHEDSRAIDALMKEADGYKVYSWDFVSGTRDHEAKTVTKVQEVEALNSMIGMPDSSILFFKDSHKFMQNLAVVRTIKNLIPVLKSSDKHLVLVSPVMSIPIELEKDVTTFPFALPTVGELMEVAQKLVEGNDLGLEVEEGTISAAKGLTLAEAENALALSVISTSEFKRDILEAEKLQAVKKSGLMEIYPACEESELGGLDSLKAYIRNRRQGFLNPELPSPKGILIMGMPGTGKSLSAKVIAHILGLPLVRLDLASLKSSLVGDSEKRLRQALQIIDALHGSVVWIEEAEKAISGVQSSGKTDGGTTSAMFGYLLSWMQESESPHYLVGTVNEIEDLLSVSQGAFLRRFDDLFYVDSPSEKERTDILGIMNRRYKTSIPLDMAKKMNGWTGAEIEKFTKASVYDGVDEAFKNIKPISEQNKAGIEKVKEWAKINCRWANAKPEATTKGRRLKI